MRIIGENFGPLINFDIKIKPFSIFIGPNASGKSYVAYLIWCLLRVEPDFDKLDKILQNHVKDIKDPNLTKGIKDFLKSSLYNPDLFYVELENLLKDTFSINEVSELIQEGTQEAKFIITNNSGSAKISFSLTKEKGLQLEKIEGIKNKIESLEIKTKRAIRNTSGIKVILSMKGEELYSLDLQSSKDIYKLSSFIPIVFEEIFDGYSPYFEIPLLPDGKAGLMRAHSAIVYLLMDRKWKPVIPLNAADAEFMRAFEILEPRIKDKEIANLASFIEEKMNAQFLLYHEPPRYVVKIRGLKMPIERASSGHREIAPLILTLKYGLIENAMLIMEEPEAHLHPDAHSIITRALARLSQFSEVLITTHSVYILDEISNLIKLNELNSMEKKELGYEEWEGIVPDDVGIYFFSFDGKVKSLEITEEGIEESGLDQVVLEMANAHARVESKFESKRVSKQYSTKL